MQSDSAIRLFCSGGGTGDSFYLTFKREFPNQRNKRIRHRVLISHSWFEIRKGSLLISPQLLFSLLQLESREGVL